MEKDFLTVVEIVNQLKSCGYEIKSPCEGAPLERNSAFVFLEKNAELIDSFIKRARHTHGANPNIEIIDKCRFCGEDLRHWVHKRTGEG